MLLSFTLRRRLAVLGLLAASPAWGAPPELAPPPHIGPVAGENRQGDPLPDK
jgi:hypothetical protein